MEWTKLEPEHKQEFFEWVLGHPGTTWPQVVREWVVAFWGTGEKPVPVKVDTTPIDPGSQLVLTWQGSWGLLQRSDVAVDADEL